MATMRKVSYKKRGNGNLKKSIVLMFNKMATIRKVSHKKRGNENRKKILF